MNLIELNILAGLMNLFLAILNNSKFNYALAGFSFGLALYLKVMLK